MRPWISPVIAFVVGCILFGCGSSSTRKVEVVPDSRPPRLTVETVVGPTGIVWECVYDSYRPGAPTCTPANTTTTGPR